MAETRVVVVGANAAGMSAAHQALRVAAAHDRELAVVALEATQDTSYSACGIPYWIAGDVDSPDDLVARSAEGHRDLGVDLRLGAVATALDLDAKTVSYRDTTGRGSVEPFDELVLATGSDAVVPPWARTVDGEPIRGVHAVKSLDDGRLWLDLLDALASDARAVIVGGGYIGVEMAETLVGRGLHATLLTRSVVMSTLDRDMGERVDDALRGAGVVVSDHTEVASIEVGADGGVTAVVTVAGDILPADVVVVGVGAAPSTRLGREAGISVGRQDGYLPDPAGSIAPSVWAAGDCCETVNRMTGEFAFIPLGTHANKLGRVVGTNLGGGTASFGGNVATAITRFSARSRYVEIARTGLSTGQAAAAGYRPVGLVTEGTTSSGYMPEAQPIATKMIGDADSRLLLGAQIVGGHTAGKRIDPVAAALWGRMTVDDLAGMDLSYAPPFATTWEAVQIAARRLADRL